MAGDRQYSEEYLEEYIEEYLRIKYSEEISENLKPEPGLALPVLSPEETIKFEKWRIRRAFLFLTGTSAMCICALIICPLPIVQVGVVCIWASTVTLGKYLLRRSYNHTNDRLPPPS